MTENQIILRSFLDCLREATNQTGEEFQAAFSIGNVRPPMKPYFTGDIFYGYLDPSNNSNQGWIVIIAYRFYWYGLSSLVFRKRVIESLGCTMSQEMVTWIVETVNEMKRDLVERD